MDKTDTEIKQDMLNAMEALLKTIMTWVTGSPNEPPKPLEAYPLTFFGMTVDPHGWENVMLPMFERQRQMNLDIDAPFGRYGDGKAKIAPAYDKCQAMWKAAQNEGLFNVWDFLPGLRSLAVGADTQPRPKFENQHQLMEDTICALATTDWGKAWLSNDTNLSMIDKAYQIKFTGHYVITHPNGIKERVPV